MNVKHVAAGIVALAAMNFSQLAAADEYSVGVGVGYLYSGLGLNVARHHESDLGYLAAGCIALSHSTDNGTDTACGGGVGWLRAFDDNRRHGFGVHLGAVTAVQSASDDLITVYGIALPYVYFPAGISQTGINFGIAPAVGWHKGHPEPALGLQLGIQM